MKKERRKLMLMIGISVATITFALLMSSCSKDTTRVVPYEVPEVEEVKTPIENIFEGYSFQAPVRTFIYNTDDGVQYRVFIYGNGTDEAGLVVINESLEKEQLRYYSKLR